MGITFPKFQRHDWRPRYVAIDEDNEDNIGEEYRPKLEAGGSYGGRFKISSLKNSHILFGLMLLAIYLLGWLSRAIAEQYTLRSSTGTTVLGFNDFPVIPKEITRISEQRIFWNNRTFDLNRHDDEAKAAWDSYFSRFISLDDDMVESSGLPPSTRFEGRQVYSVAAYHHLHCLHVIRQTWDMLKMNGPSVLSEPFPGLESIAEGYTYEGHVSHCLDMIRQALECHADPTLEPMMKDDGITSGGNLASGWGGTPHQCRDFQALTNWIDSPDQNPIASVEVFIEHHHHNHHSHKGAGDEQF